MKLASAILSAALAAVFPTAILAQTPAAKPAEAAAKPAEGAKVRCDEAESAPVHTFYLSNAAQQADANEIVTAVRNTLGPCDKVFLVANQDAIVVRGSSEDLDLVQKLINDLDHHKKTYRLTYTVSELDGTKLIGTQHFAMIVAGGQQTVLKQGSKVPLATGSYDAGDKGPAGVQTQFTYVDVGMNFDATLDELANGVRLRSDVEQSSVAGESSIAGVQEPVIRQTSLKGAAFLIPGKPLVLGSIDIPGTTRHLDIEVVMEQLP